MSQVLYSHGLEVNDFTLSFDPALGHQGDRAVRDPAVLLINLRSDNQIGRACFILDSAKDYALCGSGPLPNQH